MQTVAEIFRLEPGDRRPALPFEEACGGLADVWAEVETARLAAAEEIEFAGGGTGYWRRRLAQLL